MFVNKHSSQLRWPHSVLAGQWRAEDLAEVIRHSALPDNILRPEHTGISISACYEYPLHSSLMSLIPEIQSFYEGGGDITLGPFSGALDNSVLR